MISRPLVQRMLVQVGTPLKTLTSNQIDEISTDNISHNFIDILIKLEHNY